MKAVIIDNERNIIDGLIQLLAFYAPDVEVIGTAGSVTTGCQLLATTSPDLLFLDVELDDGTGMDLLRQFDQEPSFDLVFITAYEKYALDAFRFSAIEFLLKPFDPDDLINCMAKVRERQLNQHWKLRFSVLSENLEHLKQQNLKIVLSGKEQVQIVKLADIVCCEASGSYTYIQLEDQKILMSKSMKYYQNLLESYGFIRVHHSFLINRYKISSYNRMDSMLELEGGHHFPVSNRKREHLKQFFNDGIIM